MATAGLTPYHESLFNARMRAVQRSLSVTQATRVAVAKAAEDTARLLRLDKITPGAPTRVAQTRLRKLDRVYDELGGTIAQAVSQGVSDTAVDVAGSYQKATDGIVQANSARVDATFSNIPRATLDLFVNRTSATGESLILSPAVWATEQVQQIELKIGAAIARGQSAKDLAKTLEAHVLGGPGAGGMSVKAKAMRTARTEISVAYWESSSLSAAQSQIVEGQRWNLSASHARWDACDLMAHQNSYDLGAGIYPAGSLPPRPHPNCLCWLEDIIRDPSQWGTPRPDPPPAGATFTIHEDALPQRMRGKIGVADHFTPLDLELFVSGKGPSERLHITENFAFSQGKLGGDLYRGAEWRGPEWVQAIRQAGMAGQLVTLKPPPTGPMETPSAGGALPEGFEFSTAEQLGTMARDEPPTVYYKILKKDITELRPGEETQVQRKGWLNLPEASSARAGFAERTMLKVRPTTKVSGLGDLNFEVLSQVERLDREVTQEIAAMVDRYPILNKFQVRQMIYEGQNKKAAGMHAFADNTNRIAANRRDLYFNLDSVGHIDVDTVPLVGKKEWTVNKDKLVGARYQAPTRGTVRHEMGHHVEGIYRKAVSDEAVMKAGGEGAIGALNAGSAAVGKYEMERDALYNAYAKSDQQLRQDGAVGVRCGVGGGIHVPALRQDGE